MEPFYVPLLAKQAPLSDELMTIRKLLNSYTNTMRKLLNSILEKADCLAWCSWFPIQTSTQGPRRGLLKCERPQSALVSL